MTPERWKYLKALKPSSGRWFFLSAPIKPIISDITGKVVGMEVDKANCQTYMKPETIARKKREALAARNIVL